MSNLFQLRRPPFRTYSISQLCREFGVTPRTVRFYEERGLLFPARRDATRVFSYKDRARLALAVRGRRVGLTLAEIRVILDAYEERGTDGQNAIALEVFRKRIEALRSQRAEVDTAIEALKAASRRLAGEQPAVVGFPAG